MSSDKADLLIASVDGGTNGGTAWTPPDSVPASSPTLLVTNYLYSYDGSVGAVLDVVEERKGDSVENGKGKRKRGHRRLAT